MAKRNFADKIKLTSYDDMFKIDDDVCVDGNIVEVPLGELHTFKNHPFSVVEDEKMDETVESIKKYGVLVPGIVRPRDNGGYEIISGHRRHHASILAGKETMPVIIKECTDDEATIIMVDSNIQRESILPSEKAKAYKMKYEALKHQGTSGGSTLANIGESSGDSRKTVQRYVWLANLTDELLGLVDEGKLGFMQGVDISFVEKKVQEWVYDVISSIGCTVSRVQSAQIKELSKKNELTLSAIRDILKKESKGDRKVVFNAKRLNSYFEPHMTNEDIENIIINLLEEWKQKRGN